MADAPTLGSSSGDLSLFRVLIQAVSKLTQLQRIGNTLPFGSVLAVTLGTSSAQIIGPDPNRTGIIFHNASLTIPILVAPITDANGNALAPTFASPQGGFIIYPADYLPLSGNVQIAFNGAAQSSSGVPLTILTSSF